jgi:hypothetical protein
VRRDSGGLRIDFDFSGLPGGEAAPDRLVLTVAGDNEPPVVETLVVDTLVRGTVHLRRRLDPQRSYRVLASTIAGDGMPTAPGPAIPLGPAPERRISAILRTGLDVLDRLWNRVRRR